MPDLTLTSQEQAVVLLLRLCQAASPASGGSPADYATLVQRMDTMSDSQNSLSQKVDEARAEVAGLRDDLQAAGARNDAHEAAHTKAIQDLQAQIATMQGSGDNAAAVAGLTQIVDDLKAARALAQGLDADAAAPTGGDTTPPADTGATQPPADTGATTPPADTTQPPADTAPPADAPAPADATQPADGSAPADATAQPADATRPADATTPTADAATPATDQSAAPVPDQNV